MLFGRWIGLSVPIFLLWRKAKMIYTSIPNAESDFRTFLAIKKLHIIYFAIIENLVLTENKNHHHQEHFQLIKVVNVKF